LINCPGTSCQFRSFAVDLLGGSVHRGGDRSAVPPDCTPRQRQGLRLLPEQRLGQPRRRGPPRPSMTANANTELFLLRSLSLTGEGEPRRG
jgi:hypothetical protein